MQLQVESIHWIAGKGLVWIIDLEKNKIPVMIEAAKALIGTDVESANCEAVVTNIEYSWKLISPPILDKTVGLIIRIKAKDPTLKE